MLTTGGPQTRSGLAAAAPAERSTCCWGWWGRPSSFLCVGPKLFSLRRGARQAARKKEVVARQTCPSACHRLLWHSLFVLTRGRAAKASAADVRNVKRETG